MGGSSQPPIPDPNHAQPDHKAQPARQNPGNVDFSQQVKSFSQEHQPNSPCDRYQQKRSPPTLLPTMNDEEQKSQGNWQKECKHTRNRRCVVDGVA
ncbi:MAG TPA: hypothetical protein IGS37_12325 [Synechococcales cyanobacterium M55_K2018_004]|nr:hypothetical protein [Synechococcales cyanobacterium M55_K2018_004]